MATQKAQRKAAQRALVASRLTAALANVYANGRVNDYPNETSPEGFADFWEWLSDYAEREVEYMTVERFGMAARELRAPRFYMNAALRLADARRELQREREEATRNGRTWGTYAGETVSLARNFYAFPSGPFERDHAALIRNGRAWMTRDAQARNGGTYRAPDVWQHGRNGKTFYPGRFFSSDIRGLHVREDHINAMAYAERAELAQFIEQFNSYVGTIAKGAAEAYADEARERLSEKAETARDEMRDARETFHALKLELRALGNLNAPNVCNVMRANLARLARDVHANAAQLSRIRSTIANLGA